MAPRLVDDIGIYAQELTLRDDGMSYGDYAEQLTYLLFLKMADERSRPPYSQLGRIPGPYAWPSLLARDGDALFDHYRHTLDGWAPPPGKAVITEVYPSIFHNRYPRDDRSPDEQDAYATARWMADMASRGALAACLDPPLAPAERALAALEGWILGVR